MTSDLFITGTDTNVGKTILSALLCAALEGSYWKPIQTGASEGTDRCRVLEWAELPKERALPETYCFDLPLSPHLASHARGIVIELGKIVRPEAAAGGPLIVEGAGGVLVPLNDTELMADLMVHLRLPVLVAARTSLGTINHTLLTLSALRQYSLEVKGVVLIGEENPDNRRSIEKYGNVPVVGWIPWLEGIHRQALLEVFHAHFDKAHF
jgi:dethiobiotin synthase